MTMNGRVSLLMPPANEGVFPDVHPLHHLTRPLREPAAGYQCQHLPQHPGAPQKNGDRMREGLSPAEAGQEEPQQQAEQGYGVERGHVFDPVGAVDGADDAQEDH